MALELVIDVARALGRLAVDVVMRDDEIAFPGTYEFVERGAVLVASTKQASDRLRERERRMLEAKTAEERATIQGERTVFRISLTFDGDEGKLVKRVLGERPAMRLVELCRGQLVEV